MDGIADIKELNKMIDLAIKKSDEILKEQYKALEKKYVLVE